MFALSPIVLSSSVLATPPATVSLPVSDTASTRLTAVAVAAPLSNTTPENNPKPASQPPIVPQENANGNGSSTAYLAQAISQNEGVQNDNAILLENTFAHFAPAQQYDTFAGYGIVKYRPSDAGLPSDDSGTPLPDAVSAADVQAYSNTQSRNQSSGTATEPQIQLAG